MIDIHNYQRNLDSTLRRIEQSDIGDANKKHVRGFHHHCLTEGISAGKVNRYVFDVAKLARLANKDLESCTKHDIEKIVIDLEKSKYAEWTKYCFKVSVRKFFKWIRNTPDFPEEVKWIKLKQKNFGTKLPEELLTDEEVKRMIARADKPRDRALIAMLYESGCRIYELLTIRMKHVSFDTYGATINVSGKTGSRRIRLVFSVTYLQEWINRHPSHDDPDSFVWIKENHTKELLGYARVREVLKTVAKRAGIKKKVNPHNFRHARASFMANHLTESQLKEVFGWTQASRMASVYVHLSGRNTDHAVLKMYGKVIEHQETIDYLAPQECVRCKITNEATNKFCKGCGMILGKEAYLDLIHKEAKQQEANKLMDILMRDSDVRALLAQKIKEVEQ